MLTVPALSGKSPWPPKVCPLFSPLSHHGTRLAVTRATGGAVLLQGTHVLGFFGHFSLSSGASRVAQTVKSLTAMWDTWVRSLVLEDPLENGMATHSGSLAWRVPWIEKPGGL